MLTVKINKYIYICTYNQLLKQIGIQVRYLALIRKNCLFVNRWLRESIFECSDSKNSNSYSIKLTMIKSNRQFVFNLIFFLFYLFQCQYSNQMRVVCLAIWVKAREKKHLQICSPTKPFRAPAFIVAFIGCLLTSVPLNFVVNTVVIQYCIYYEI